MPLIIDSHLDLAWNALAWKRDLTQPLEKINAAEAARAAEPGRSRATVSLPAMRSGGVALCLATLIGRVPYGASAAVHGDSLDFPSHSQAYGFAQGQLAYYRLLSQLGETKFLFTARDLADHWRSWLDEGSPRFSVGTVLAMEGCDPIIAPAQAEAWFRDGLRCAGLVHYGRSAYAVGTGDDGPLTPSGRDLLAEFARLGIILDLTHLSDTSFFEAIDLFPGPVLASHQNCRALVPGDRQFSDEQIRLVIERGGILGTAFDNWMLYPGWIRGQTSRATVDLGAVVDHIDHICQLAGNCRHNAIGSDLDGGFGNEQTPTGLDRISDLGKLEDILTRRGYTPDDIDAIFHGNLLRFLSEQLPR
ncbi:MAG TPA: membrane dipeptidase [Verrucomicrobiales bacterium]|nr:membrane dipeptidase [Verrucomicrobiales bacterium]